MENHVRSVKRAIRILELIGRDRSKRITDISRELNIPKSSVYQIISELVNEKILEKDNESNLYFLGLKIFELANMARFNLEIIKVSTVYLEKLNKKLDETIQLTVLESGEVLYVACLESKKRLRTHCALGERAPLHCTGVGKAILAFMPAYEVERIIQKKGLKKFTKNTITDKNALFKELRKISNQGYSIDNMEHEDGIRCVAVPIRNHEGNVFASISVSGPSQRITKEVESILAESMKDTAIKISTRLGYKI